MSFGLFLCAALASWATAPALAGVAQAVRGDGACQKTTVAVLGGGMASIMAAQALSNALVSDFVIVEYQDRLGRPRPAEQLRDEAGRVGVHGRAGSQLDPRPGAVRRPLYVRPLSRPCGLLSGERLRLTQGMTENPVWMLAQKHGLQNTYSDYDSIATYDEQGAANFTQLIADYKAAARMSVEAGRLLADNGQDQSAPSTSSSCTAPCLRASRPATLATPTPAPAASTTMPCTAPRRSSTTACSTAGPPAASSPAASSRLQRPLDADPAGSCRRAEPAPWARSADAVCPPGLPLATRHPCSLASRRCHRPGALLKSVPCPSLRACPRSVAAGGATLDHN